MTPRDDVQGEGRVSREQLDAMREWLRARGYERDADGYPERVRYRIDCLYRGGVSAFLREHEGER